MKGKIWKKAAAVVMAFAMLASVTACGQKDAANDTQTGNNAGEKKEFKIGYLDDGASDGAKTPLVEQLKVTIEGLGGTAVVVAPETNTADGCIDALNILVSKGIDGVVLPYSFFSEANLPTLASICEKAGVYWGLYWSQEEFSDEVMEVLNQSEHFVGVAYQDDYQAGLDGMMVLHEAGCSQIGYIGLPQRDEALNNTRDKGIEQACKDFDMEILAEQRDYAFTTNSEGGAKTIENYLTAYPQMDGIMIAGMTQYVLPGVMQSLSALGREDIKVACIDFSDTMKQYAETGQVLFECGGHNNGASYITILIANRLQGNALSDEPVFLPEQYVRLYTLDEFEQYEAIKNEVSYTKEEMEQCLVANNPDFNLDALTEMVKAYSLEDIVSRHKK